MSEVKLFKKKGSYVDKDGNEKTYTNFYVRCGDDNLIPVQVCYFENEEGRDPQYSVRRGILSAFAETLPDKPNKEDKHVKPEAQKSLKPMDDESVIPF